MVTSNGLDIIVLSQTAFEAWRHASARYDGDWVALGQNEKEAWEHVAGQAILLLDQERDEISAKELAACLHEAYQRGMGSEHKMFQDLPDREKICWEAVGRHLFNLIDSDGTVTINEVEPHWRDWAEKKFESNRSIA